MRSRINLASQPYEDAQRFYLQWVGLLLALAVITALLITLVVRSHRASRDIARKVAQERSQIAEVDRERADDEAILNRPANRDVRDKSRFLNALIVRKAFSWTQVFSDLERIVPPRVRIVSIHPDVNLSNQLEIHLEAIGDSREKANELLRHMEESPTFREPQLRVERPSDTPGGSPGIDFTIVAQYVPQVPKENR
ncbi:MAG: PilN domain-containing protein [Terriglobales bacterium]